MKKTMLILAILFLFAGCTQQKTETVVGTATVVIDTLDDTIVNEAISFTENSTAYDITISACEKTDVEVEFDGTEKTAYMTSAGGVKTGDYGAMSGWLFDINDEPASQGCGQYTVQDGDVIHWYYVEDFMAEF